MQVQCDIFYNLCVIKIMHNLDLSTFGTIKIFALIKIREKLVIIETRSVDNGRIVKKYVHKYHNEYICIGMLDKTVELR